MALQNLAQADFMLMGPDEQMMVKDSMQDSYERCNQLRLHNFWKCLMLSESV